MEDPKTLQVSTANEFPIQRSSPETPNIPTWRLVLLTISLCTGLFVSLLDTSIVATALYSISTSFSSPHTTTWVALSYSLSYLSFAVPFANLSDVIGRRAVVGLVVAIAGVMGPVVGGVITRFASWRWVFWIK
jgi:MFS family permease